jgi:hypothetical protein
MNRRRNIALVTFAILAVIWLFMVGHGTWGFVRPHDSHAKFVDVLHTLVWIAFLVSGWRVYTVFRRRRA